MKMKKIIKAIKLLPLTAVITLTACSSGSREYQYLPPAVYSWEIGHIRDISYGEKGFLPGQVDKEHEAVLESIFDKITVPGATLSLPMNVSDLPEGLILTDDDYQAIETGDGKYITYGKLSLDEDNIICSKVCILREKNKDISQGIIVGLQFMPIAGTPLIYAGDGYNVLYMTPDEVTALLGETDIIDRGDHHLVYTDAHGRRAGWEYDRLDDKVTYNFTLTAHSALDYEHLW